jgi:hypothetical protein
LIADLLVKDGLVGGGAALHQEPHDHIGLLAMNKKINSTLTGSSSSGSTTLITIVLCNYCKFNVSNNLIQTGLWLAQQKKIWKSLTDPN